MALIRFPDPRDAGADGLLAVGGNLRPETLLAAYRRGIFPWPIEGWPLTWFSPKERAVLLFDELHVARSLARERRRTRLQFTVDKNFRGVVESCARVFRPHERGTWITREMVEAYCELHARGHAHSVEAWEGRELVGGVYGVDAGGTFAGESMFHTRTNASKLALLFLIEHLKSHGLDWLDIQVMTPHMEALGAKEIDRESFLEKLSEALRRGLRLFPEDSLRKE
jgi:leucyl/phenylalanyl-tRNA--protein transferase